EAPDPQRHAQVVGDLACPVHRGDVDAAAQAGRGVEQHPAESVHEVAAAALQQAVDGRPDVAQIAEDVVDTGAHRTRRDGFIARGDGLEHGAIHRVVE